MIYMTDVGDELVDGNGLRRRQRDGWKGNGDIRWKGWIGWMKRKEDVKYKEVSEVWDLR